MSYLKSFFCICLVILIAGIFGGCQKENDFLKLQELQPNDSLYQYSYKKYQLDLNDTFSYDRFIFHVSPQATGKIYGDSVLNIVPLKTGTISFKIVAVDSQYDVIREQKISYTTFSNPHFTSELRNHKAEGLPPSKSKDVLEAYYLYKKHHQLGEKLPDFNLQDAFGNKFTNTDIKGEVSMLTSWYQGCLPCANEMPELRKIKQFWNDHPNVNLFGLYRDSVQMRNDTTFIQYSAIWRHAKRDTMKPSPHPFHQLGNAEPYLKSAGFLGYPTNLILDQNGKVVWIQGGSMKEYVNYLSHQANYTIKQLLEDN